MKFGNVDINETIDWSAWSWKDFLQFYDTLKDHVTESPEEIAKVLGVKVPVQKPKGAEV